MAMAETQAQQPLAVARTNTRPGSVVDVMVSLDEELMLFDPLNECVYVVPRGEPAKAVLAEAGQMQSLVQKLATAREAVLDNEAKLASLNATRFPSLGEVNAVKEALKMAQSEYERAYADVKAELGDKGYLASSGDGKELLELVPLAKRREGGKPKEWARKWTYVRSDKVKDHWRKYRLNSTESAQTKSFIKKGKIDSGELRKQFTQLDPKLKAEWVLGHEAGYLAPQLQAWAEQLNVKADETKPVQFSAALHLFRYFAGCGAALEWAPRSGKVAGKLNAKAELNLAYGECKAEGFLPSSPGWVLMMAGAKSSKEFHIGAIRLLASAKLTGSAGASVAAELALEVDYSRLMAPGVKGARRSKTTPLAGTSVKLAELGSGANGNAGVDLFAGAKVGGEFKGALQYQNPEKGDKFEDMAAIGPKVDLLLGAGAAAALMVTYQNGKFRFKAKAGVCLGPGAKGEIGLEVDAKRVGSFLEWFFHALLNAGFEFLDIVVEDAYKAATRLHVLMVQGVTDAYESLELEWSNFIRSIEREDRNVALMERVLSDPPTLRYCPPEAHGILLWHLSRHGKLTKTTHLAANSDWDEVLGKRKRAIAQVCRWAQCRSQFENMVQHMGDNGQKGNFQSNYAHLLRFMEIGPGDSGYDDELQRLYARLPLEPARGYAVAQNHTSAFLAQARMGNAPIYLAQAQGFPVSGGTVVV